MAYALTTSEAATALETSVRVVQRWVKQGRLGATKEGRDWRIDPIAVARFRRRVDHRCRRKPTG